VPFSAAAEAPVSVAAAADLQYALDEILAAYAQQQGARPRVTYGSSGNFFTQLMQGAPFDIFMSADETLVNRLAAQGLTRDQGDLYALGRVVLFVPAGVTIAVDGEFADVRRALADGRLQKFAIANPEHAPYGRAARESLQANGLWDAVASHLVLGENVAQAAQFTCSGAAQAGIFALSLALAPPFRQTGRYVVIDSARHAPLRQRMVLMARAGAAAQGLYRYLQSPAARAVFDRYGFTLPDS
jgi:molybdate transport system substrate-binding protein